MNDYLICNSVPAYLKAPVSVDIWQDHASQVLQNLAAKKAVKNYIIVAEDNQDILSIIENAAKKCPTLNLELIKVDGGMHFVYSNATAAKKVIEGEKPIPSGMDSSLPVYAVEELLDSPDKRVYIAGNALKKGSFCFEKRIQPKDILFQCGSKKFFKAMYFGYPMGLMVGENELEKQVELTTDYISMFDETDCILDRLVHIIDNYAKESCGRCVFGYEGMAQAYMILFDIAQKKGKSDDIQLLLDLCGQMQYQALCDIGTIAAKTIIKTINDFREEIENHITKKSCKAIFCKKFATYHILTDLCNGCNECQDQCEDGAILGKKKFVHVIDQDECMQCGACIDVCAQKAIVKAGSIKPNCPKKPIPCKISCDR